MSTQCEVLVSKRAFSEKQVGPKWRRSGAEVGPRCVETALLCAFSSGSGNSKIMHIFLIDSVCCVDAVLVLGSKIVFMMQ